jgi:mono/diheme cytochrome c family protein
MYNIDANLFMNAVVVAILGTAGVLAALSLAVSAFRKTKGGLLSRYLFLFTALFGCFAAIVGILGLREQKSASRPWHFFLDMKYQGKYTSQGASRFFADGRANRLPPADTIPFDGTDYIADAGYHDAPRPEFLKADLRYFHGVADPAAKDKDPSGAELRREPKWENGKITSEGYYTARIPPFAVESAGGWEPLIKRGQQQFNVHCAICHGSSGMGGGADGAYGVVGAYGLSVAPSSIIEEVIQTQPDGQLFHTISNGVRNMPGYAHQVKVQDRWAIVAYIRVLQYAAKR